MNGPTIGRRLLLGSALALPALGMAGRAAAQTSEERRIRDILADPAKLNRFLSDPASLSRYGADNARLTGSGAKIDIVFLGDSITEGWKVARPDFFEPGRVNRGISGQTTPQMLVRMMPDVIDLKPRAVHIMAGTNDIAGNTGPMTQEMTRDNIRAMTAIARHNGLQILLASIPPAASFPWRPGVETMKPIHELNAWLRSYAAEIGATYVDYHSAMAAADGGMRPGLASDGVHPTPTGYDAMIRVVEPLLKTIEG